jgi:T5SS/PEP-CTERM-associated repeat protein/autotransporter-associated beta strand protein
VLYGTVLSGTLIQAAGHTISGYGTIAAALTNEGLVDAAATGRSLVLSTDNLVNNGIMECTGGVLDINGITVTQGTGGELVASIGHVQLDTSPTISGGALYSSGTGSPFIVSTGVAAFKSVTNNAVVSLQAGTTLNVAGNMPGSGSITVNSGGTGTVTVLDFQGGVISGTGVVLLNGTNEYAQLEGMLTQGAGHTIRGFGEVNAALTNDGLVNATVPGEALTLSGSSITNNNTIEAGGGLLDISGITVTQAANGQLLAAGGNVQFDGATTVKGGLLNSSSAASVFVVNSGGAFFTSLTNDATVNMVAGTTLTMSGTLTDNGRIVVDSGGTSALTVLDVNGGSVTGSGAIILNAGGGDAELTGTLTQTASHTISGIGVIDAALTNNGTVNADVAGQTLTVNGLTTNRGVMEASGSGTLSFAPGVLSNLSGSTLTGGAYEAFGGSTIGLSGSITTNSATVILSGSGSTFSAINSVGANYGEFEVEGGRSFATRGALVNFGALVAADGALAIDGTLTENAAGSLSISSGGSVSDHGAYIGSSVAGTSSVAVSGSGSKWTNTGNLDLGYSGTGTLTITGGGLANVTGTTTIGSAGTLEFDGGSTFDTGSLAVNGGKVVTLGAATFVPSATLGAGGMNVNSNGFSSIFSGNFSGAGGIAKSGSGTITLTGSNTYTGATSVAAGTLALTTGAGHTASLGNTAITVASGATFSATLGASPFSKTVNAGITGTSSAGATLTLEPGSSLSLGGPSLATFDLQQGSAFSGPAFTIGGASGIAPSLIFDIGNAAAGTDLLRVTRTVSVLATGGDITIDPLAGDTSLTAGSYDLIVSAGGFSGTGGNGLELSGTTLAISGTTYDLSLAHSTADDEILTVTDAPAAPSAAAPAGRESAPLVGTSAVPEPGTTMSLLSVFGMAGAWIVLRRRGR